MRILTPLRNSEEVELLIEKGYEKEFRLFEEFDGNIILKGKTRFMHITNLQNLKQSWIDSLVINPIFKE